MGTGPADREPESMTTAMTDAESAATMETVTEAPAARQPSAGFWTSYGRLWRRVPVGVGVLFVLFPLAVVAVSVLWTLFGLGIGLLVLVAGFFILLAALFVARGNGTLTLKLLDATGQPPIPRPVWRTPQKAGFIGRVFGPLADGHYWLYLLDGLVVQLVISTITWSIMITWVASALGGVTYWIWGIFASHGQTVWIASIIWEWGTRTPATFDPLLGDMVLYAIVGVVFLFTLPYVIDGLVRLHWAVARGLLGAWESDALRREVSQLSESRAAAVAAEDRALRRLERDIHDGPQQRLVRLRMDIAAAQRRVADDPDAAARLLDEAGATAQDALDELRALSRGFAPPILQDRGLAAALDSLAARSPLPVTVTNDIPHDVTVPSEVERNVYFVAAELLTNVVKHSGATHATVGLSLEGPTLVLTVADDGEGGAIEVAGHGLAGMRERMTALRGTAHVESSATGTKVGISVPLS